MEQQYEQSFTSTIIFNVVIVLVIFILFPLLRILLPSVYNTQLYLPSAQRYGYKYYIWIVDVFKQPLSVYTSRGNMQVVVYIFQQLIIVLFGILSILSLTILVPVYSYGTDASFFTNYLTIWSKLSIAHIEKGSLMLIIPSICTLAFSLIVMKFYEQFTIIYSFYKQKCLKRIIPQNFVILIENIPDNIETLDELHNVLRPIQDGIEAIVPVPQRTRQLNQYNSKVSKLKKNAKNKELDIQYIKCQIQSYRVQTQNMKNNLEFEQKRKSENIKNCQKQINKLTKKINKTRQYLRKNISQYQDMLQDIRQYKNEILAIIYEDNIDRNYLYYSDQRMEGSQTQDVERLIRHLPTKTQTIRPIYYNQDDDKNIITQQQEQELEYQQLALSHVKSKKKTIGRSAFIVCKSQQIAAQKQSSLISQNQQQFKTKAAPSQYDLDWIKLSSPLKIKQLKTFIFIILIIALFLAYMIGQNELLGLINSQQNLWYEKFFGVFCPNSCNFSINGASEDSTIVCTICDSFSSMLVTAIPSMLNSFVQVLLPIFINILIGILDIVSETERQDLSYQILYIFLILLMGIIQILIPNVVNMNTGGFNFSELGKIDLGQLIQSFGRNIVQQQFTMLNYIISKYFTFAVFDLINMFGLTFGFLGLFVSRKIKSRIIPLLRDIEANFAKTMASITHMVTVSFIFSISAPTSNVIVFITFLTMVCSQRYVILNYYRPSIQSDLSAQNKMLVKVMNSLYIAVLFNNLGMCCYFGTQGWWFGLAVSILSIIITTYQKITIDKKYNRSIQEIARGNYKDTVSLDFNPVGLYDIYESDNQKVSRIKKKFMKKSYKMNFIDKIYKKFYLDLTNLPVSVMQLKNEDGDQREFVQIFNEQTKIDDLSQNGEKILEYDGKQLTKDEVNIMADYTHPALKQVVFE